MNKKFVTMLNYAKWLISNAVLLSDEKYALIKKLLNDALKHAADYDAYDEYVMQRIELAANILQYETDEVYDFSYYVANLDVRFEYDRDAYQYSVGPECLKGALQLLTKYCRELLWPYYAPHTVLRDIDEIYARLLRRFYVDFDVKAAQLLELSIIVQNDALYEMLYEELRG